MTVFCISRPYIGRIETGPLSGAVHVTPNKAFQSTANPLRELSAAELGRRNARLLSSNKELKNQHDDKESRGATQTGDQSPRGHCGYRRYPRHDAAGPLLLEFDRLGCRWSSNSGACAPERAWREGYAGHAGRNASLHGSCDVGHSTSAGSLAGRRARTSPNLRSPDNSHGKRCHLRGLPYVAGHSAEQSSGGVRLRTWCRGIHYYERTSLGVLGRSGWPVREAVRPRLLGVASRGGIQPVYGFALRRVVGRRAESQDPAIPGAGQWTTCVDGSAECRR